MGFEGNITSRRRLRVTPAPKNLQRCSEEKFRRVEMMWDSITSVCLSDCEASYGRIVEL